MLKALFSLPVDESRIGMTGLARYFDYGTGPVPEMADDSTYYPDVIRWLVAHPPATKSKEGGEGFLNEAGGILDDGGRDED